MSLIDQLNTVSTDVEKNNVTSLMSVDHSGRYISKIELMLYINNMLRILEQFDRLGREYDGRAARLIALRGTLKRRIFSMPTMERPHGLASFSRQKKQEYEEFLSHEEERKAELLRKEKAEDERINATKMELDRLDKELQAIFNAQPYYNYKYA